MSTKYPIVTVEYECEQIESIGSKAKFWYTDEKGCKYLFKIGRPKTGENWSEFVSSKLAELVGIPHAIYSLATYCNRLGTICKTIAGNNNLIHGNELLFNVKNLDYPEDVASCGHQKIPQYTLKNVLLANSHTSLKLPLGFTGGSGIISRGLDVFIGYLVFDAWIGNTDRHHQNWAWILSEDDFSFSLSPSFDHASCLGRELRNIDRKSKLETRDHRASIETYIKKSKTPFFGDVKQKSTLSTYEILSILMILHREPTKYWIGKILEVEQEQIEYIFNNIPTGFISDIEVEFALKMLMLNQDNFTKTFWGIS